MSQLFWDIQLRSEKNGLTYWPTLQEALAEVARDSTIWKMSFNLPSGERLRMERNQGEIAWTVVVQP